jgi:hypothetical protein
MEDRSGLVVGTVVSHADGFAERANALRLPDCVPGTRAKTVGADKVYDTHDFVNDCRARNVTRISRATMPLGRQSNRRPYNQRWVSARPYAAQTNRL